MIGAYLEAAFFGRTYSFPCRNGSLRQSRDNEVKSP